MKKLYSFVTVLVMAVAGMTASAESTCVTLFFNDSTTALFAFPDEPVMTFDEENLIMSYNPNLSVSYPRADVDHFAFTQGVTSAIGNVESDSDYRVDFSNPEMITVYGTDLSKAAVYNTAGVRLMEAGAKASTITLDIASLPAGIYLVAVDGHPTLKIKK